LDALDDEGGGACSWGGGFAAGAGCGSDDAGVFGGVGAWDWVELLPMGRAA
jgi:hypothetical protein